MKKIDKIIKESIDKIVNENNYKSGINKVKAATNVAHRKDGGKTPKERYNDWLAKQAALKDINAELASMRSKPKKDRIERHNAFTDDEEWEKNDFNRLSDRREQDFDDFYNSENDFYRPIYNF
jgi:hypothetical protein